MSFISRIETFLKKRGLIAAYSDDDYINAEQEDKLRELSNVTDAFQKEADQRREKTAKLRSAIKVATKRTGKDNFRALEQLIRGDRH